ncbi:MAG: TlpA disulfide reductase family protein, partial [Weeksellaceae bacterium]
ELLLYKISSASPEAERYNEFIQEYAKDKKLKEKASDSFDRIQKLLPGKPSPKFKYPDINGKKVSLDDLEGNLVYIDVWATWCGPCLAEIPSMKKLEEDYRDKKIKFVGMSIDPKKDFDKWKEMVKEKDLQGIQIFADKDWKSQFVQDYGIIGIPRFILIDAEGNIITADAPRPSDPQIRALFDERV